MTELLFAVSTQDIYTPGGTYIDEGLTIVEAACHNANTEVTFPVLSRRIRFTIEQLNINKVTFFLILAFQRVKNNTG